MNRLANTLLFVLIGASAAGAVHGDEKRREALALEVMTVTGLPEIGAEVAAGLLSQLKPAFPTVPDELWVEVAGSVSADEIVQLSIPPYVKHFSEEELAALIEFYESPIGKSLLEKMPVVAHETMMIGNEWGQRKVTEIVEKLQAAGYTPVGM